LGAALLPSYLISALTVACSLFMENLDSTVISTSLPAIAKDLHEDPVSLKLALTSYLVSLAIFIPASGWAADRFGARKIFRMAILVFTLGSILCGMAATLPGFVGARVIQGLGGAMMVPVGRLTLVRALPKSQLVRAMSFVAVPALIGPMLGPIAGGLITDYFHWSVIFFLNVPIGLAGLYLAHRHLPDYREDATPPLDLPGLLLFRSGIALLSYVLEVFGEHRLGTAATLGLLALSALLLAGYGLYAARTPHPLLQLGLFRIRTFRAAVAGSFFTRIGIGGIPFLFPLLYQVGLGYTAVQSGLLMMPQAFAAMSLKMTMPGILARFGYRTVLISNTAMLGLLIMLFATIGLVTPVWLIVVQTFTYGFLQSLQFTSMNTLVYADVSAEAAGSASTIASTAQQLSTSFGVATASLVAALFLPDRFHTDARQMIGGVHEAFLVLGVGTIASTAIFGGLRRTDGSAVSQHRADLPAA
jgi:EmrB/QacA subfamily drug resistance transporter